MSAQMQDRVASETTVVASFRKNLFSSVPPIPDTVDLRGQTAIITGSNTGIGLEASRQLLQQGLSHLILAVRSQTKGDEAARQLGSQFPNANLQVWLLDMESDASVRGFARRCESLERIDILILNAAIAKATFQRSNGGEGREVSLLVNYINTMLLAILMIPVLKTKRQGRGPIRLTIAGSDTSYWGILPETSGSLLDAVDTEKSYDGLKHYSNTKLLLVMGVVKLSETVAADEVIINYANPGATKSTGLNREAAGIWKVIAFVIAQIAGRNIVDSARQYLHSAVVLGKESHGSFTDFAIRPYPKLMYTKAGREKMDSLWNETLSELKL
ncbi:short-chain dehydrogenase reductase family [Colletotrichum karsti]|uniref:Short-chain dehydrogenase reductase family n=1 Tax=Colletotrichum karsti TaxID=1095194 RepID=A0A9P6I5D1_9PEZI|nr:short-chain dehydrogenase reductase family [Colletotrichum karsti]KAF9876095.1 short-chain dehydrogenase reductase family [Colletotrichum karsti]